jgi:hypothetical protein
MTRLTYPGAAMYGDYLRAAAGLVPTAAILATTPVGVTAGAILSGVAGLFLVFGIRTALRHGTRVELTEAAIIASGPFARSVAWSELERMKLAYYSARRDKGGGWLQLELRSGRSALRLDSRLEGFPALVERAAQAARSRSLRLDAATVANLQALGLEASATSGIRGGAA